MQYETSFPPAFRLPAVMAFALLALSMWPQGCVTGGDAEFHLRHGRRYLATENYMLARDACAKAVEQDPTKADAWYCLAHAQRGMNENDAALKSYGRAVEADPDHGDAHFGLAQLLRERNQEEEALTHYAAAAKGRRFAQAHYIRGNILFNRGAYADAARAYEQATIDDPDFAAAYTNLGVAYMKLTYWEQAEATLERALAKRPDDQNARYNLGVLYVQRDQADAARDALKAVVEAMPTYDEAWFHLALAYGRLGDKPAAIDALTHAVNAGFADRERLVNAKQFQALRDEAAFGDLVRRLDQAAPPRTERVARTARSG